VLHQFAFYAAVVAAPFAVVAADGTRASVTVAIFAFSVAACFGASALYHRVTWSPRVRPWMRRVDHAGVYLLIAGTYTPVSLLALEGAWQTVILTTVWVGAGAAIVLKFAWVDAPKWLAAAIGLALGWVAIVALPHLVSRIDLTAVVLLVVGGIAYTVGALVYAFRRPNPFPAVFGYHELFHALTLVAVACQYTAITFFVAQTS
jgi:hemolysin III